jgi:hypothetical protein
MKLEGETVTRPSFYQLFLALDENAVAVNDIVSQNKKDVDDAYNEIRTGSISPADLLKQPVIEGLIGGNYSVADIKGLEKVYSDIYNHNQKAVNILDVIYSVYTDSYDLHLVSSLVDNLTEYLNEYCFRMKNNQPGAARELFVAAAKAIGSNFASRQEASTDFKMLVEAYL